IDDDSESVNSADNDTAEEIGDFVSDANAANMVSTSTKLVQGSSGERSAANRLEWLVEWRWP
ncbi:hypothetical protein KI387_008840, partial [Taxus chinensis]